MDLHLMKTSEYDYVKILQHKLIILNEETKELIEKLYGHRFFAQLDKSSDYFKAFLINYAHMLQIIEISVRL